MRADNCAQRACDEAQKRLREREKMGVTWLDGAFYGGALAG